MVVVLGQIDVHSDDVSAAIELAKALALATNREAGCLAYAFGIDVTRPNRLLLAERWHDAEALAIHLGAVHLAAFRSGLRRLRILERSAFSYTVGNATDLIAADQFRPATKDRGSR